VTTEKLIGAVAGFDGLPVAGLIVDLDGTIALVNKAATRLLGPAAQGRKIWDYAPGLEHAWGDFAAAGEHVGEMTIVTPRGARTIEYTLSARNA